jgi:hypothetical protein
MNHERGENIPSTRTGNGRQQVTNARTEGPILSGGAGTRLRPITHTCAEQLVQIANQPVLFYGIEALVEAGSQTSAARIHGR